MSIDISISASDGEDLRGQVRDIFKLAEDKPDEGPSEATLRVMAHAAASAFNEESDPDLKDEAAFQALVAAMDETPPNPVDEV